MATSFDLRRPSSGQNIYKNLNAGVYSVLLVSVMGSHLQSYSSLYEGWNFNSGNYLFTSDTK